MFTRSARYYDAIYAKKDYAGEAAKLRALISSKIQREARTLLDVACGSGRHLAELKATFEIEGIDLNDELLALARARLPEVRFHHADMRRFDLGRTYDVVTCLFSAIGYVTSVADLNAAIAAMARHVAPGGLLIVEPWWPPDNWVVDGKPRLQFANEPDVKIARMSMSGREDAIAIVDLHYLVGSEEGIAYFTEQHRFGLFTIEEHLTAFRATGLEVTHDPVGLMGRGLYVGLKPARKLARSRKAPAPADTA
jgi:ubiquinone/menaquinone biosynthesis C-methylase UbiE